MSAKAIREYHGKKMVSRWLSKYSGNETYDLEDRALLITSSSFNNTKNMDDVFEDYESSHSWVKECKLVVKPDQLIKRRGKAGLLGINLTWPQVVLWIKERMGKEQQVEIVSGTLDTFIVEPFVPHDQSDEYYLCIQSFRTNDEILFYHQGGVDVGDVDSKGVRLSIPLDEVPTLRSLMKLISNVPESRQNTLAGFILALFQLFRELNYVYMEINPLVMTNDGRITPLDMAAKLDETAHFLNSSQWGNIETAFPAPFGRAEFPEEAFIKDLDQRSGSSLKLTILNDKGRIWTMVAGGGASVVYADTISDLGYGSELANYGEYSGAPSLQETYEYARTLLSLMCRRKDPRGKVLIIGGGIANFTDVAATFTGIQRALTEYREEIMENHIDIWVRRAGPNYQEGLKNMRNTGDELGIKIHLYGPETHITAVVPLALGLRDAADYPEFDAQEENRSMMAATSNAQSSSEVSELNGKADINNNNIDDSKKTCNLSTHVIQDSTKSTQCVVYGLQIRAVQGMLDFDFMCKREKPSVSCMVFPFSGNHYSKLYWGTEETLIPVYTSIAEAVKKHPDVSVMINFASFRSVYDTVMETFEYNDTIKTVAIIAEGVPESQTRRIIQIAKEKGVGLIGPATVGGIKPGAFRIGNTGGMLDNIIMSKLYRPGSVAYVSKSGGMSNELNNN